VSWFLCFIFFLYFESSNLIQFSLYFIYVQLLYRQNTHTRLFNAWVKKKKKTVDLESHYSKKTAQTFIRLKYKALDKQNLPFQFIYINSFFFIVELKQTPINQKWLMEILQFTFLSAYLDWLGMLFFYTA